MKRRFIITCLLILFLVLPIVCPAVEKLAMGMVLEPPHLDPTAGAAAAIDEVVYANIFEGLTGVDRRGEVMPRLADSWIVSADSKQYTFILRKGVKFHDGSPFSSADVVFSFRRAASDKSENAQKRVFANFSAIEALGPHRVRLILKEARSDLPWLLGLGDAVIVSEKSAAANKSQPVGTGPFLFDRWKKGDSVRLVKNKSYWGKPAQIDEAVFRFISNPAAANNALVSGGVDAFANFPAPELVSAFQTDKRFRVSVGSTEGETILAMNNKKKPFDDVRVRRAIALAINKSDVVAGAMFGFGELIGSHFSPAAPGYVDLTGTYPFSPEKAKKLLAEAGYPDGFKTTLKLPPPAYARRGGEIIASMLASVGIQAEIEPVEWAQWLDQVYKSRSYDMTIVSHTEPMDIEIYSRPGYYFNYDNPAFNKKMAAFYTAESPANGLELLGEVQRILAEDAPNVFMFMLPKIGIWAADIEGLWENSPIQANDLTEVRRVR